MNKNRYIIAVCVVFLIGALFLFLSNNSNEYKSEKQVRQAKQVFFDLGANKGDSLRSFVFSQGAQGGNYLVGRGGKNSGKWDLWAFEPNKVFNDQLSTLDNDLRNVRLPNGEHQFVTHILKETVANTVDGEVDFFLDTVNPGKDFWGSSLRSDHPDVIKSKNVKTKVKSINLARLIKERYTKDDYIVIKMDIEGTEYDMLLEFMKEGVLPYIDEMACEFHQYLEPKKDITTGLKWVLEKSGIKLLNWE